MQNTAVLVLNYLFLVVLLVSCVGAWPPHKEIGKWPNTATGPGLMLQFPDRKELGGFLLATLKGWNAITNINGEQGFSIPTPVTIRGVAQNRWAKHRLLFREEQRPPPNGGLYQITTDDSKPKVQEICTDVCDLANAVQVEAEAMARLFWTWCAQLQNRNTGLGTSYQALYEYNHARCQNVRRTFEVSVGGAAAACELCSTNQLLQ